jgi:hypothetical protein
MLKTFLPSIQFVNDFLTIRKRTIILHARLDDPGVKNKITTSLFVLTWSSLTLWCSNMPVTREGKSKKKTTLAKPETIISCSPPRYGGVDDMLWSLPLKLDFDHQTTSHTPSKACNHC